MIDFLQRVFTRRPQEDDSPRVHATRAWLFHLRFLVHRLALWVGLGPYLSRRLARELQRIDRTRPWFSQTCRDCGQKTADKARTVVREGQGLVRVEPQCVECAVKDPYAE